MVEVVAVIDAGTNLRFWNRSIQSLCKVGVEQVTFELEADAMIASAMNLSGTVFHTAKFPARFFSAYQFGRDRGSSMWSRRLDQGTSTFQIRSKLLNPMFKKVERDGPSIRQVKLAIKEGNHSGYGAPTMSVEVLHHTGITKNFSISCADSSGGLASPRIDAAQYKYSFQFKAKTFKRNIDLMSAQSEEFAITFKENHFELRGFTQSVYSNKDLLKQPLNTSISLEYDHLSAINITDSISFRFRLKEFKAFVNLTESLHGTATIQCTYKQPGSPILFELVPASLPQGTELSMLFFTTGETASGESNRIYTSSDGHATGSLATATNTTAHSNTNPSAAMEATIDWADDNDGEDAEQATALDTRAEGEDQSSDLDQELEQFSTQVFRDGLGPTQNVSQARGLFD